MSKRFFHILLLAFAMVTALVSCERRPLVEPSETVRIKIKVNVKTVTNVNTNIRNTVHLYAPNESLWEPKLKQLDPSLMHVVVYDPKTDMLVSERFVDAVSTGDDGQKVFSGDLTIGRGDFNFLVYNFDTPTTHVSQWNSEKTILAYTDEIPLSLRSRILGTKADEDYDGVSIYFEPEHLLVANERNVRISPHDTVVVVHTEASTVVDTYYLQVRVKGLRFADAATAVISGLSPSNHIGYNLRTVDPSAAVVFNMEKGYDTSIDGENQDVLCAVFNTFGKIDDISSNLYVTFNVYDIAGNLRQYTANLDTVFKSELCEKYHWLIINDEIIDIPDPGTDTPGGSGGFQPQVDEWEEEVGEIAI